MSHPRTSIAERLKSKYEVDTITGCWNWIGAIGSSGYGKMGAGGRYGKTISAHRAAWEAQNGPVPIGLQVLHKCDNKLCVNPAHLFVGTQLENRHDCINKGRSGYKFTPEQVRNIRLLYSRGINSYSLAERFGVGKTLIQKIVSRQCYAFVC